jgi:flagellar biogenesis protein FliO
MKSSPNEQFLRWLKKFSGFPKWAQGLIILGFMSILTLGLFFIQSGGSNSIAQDPFANSTSLALDVTFKLILVVGLIYVASIILRRWKGGKSYSISRQMELKETIHLTSKRALHLIKVEGRLFMVGSTDMSVNLISELTQPDLTEMPQEMNSSTVGEFKTLLSSTLKKNGA